MKLCTTVKEAGACSNCGCVDTTKTRRFCGASLCDGDCLKYHQRCCNASGTCVSWKEGESVHPSQAVWWTQEGLLLWHKLSEETSPAAQEHVMKYKFLRRGYWGMKYNYVENWHRTPAIIVAVKRHIKEVP